MVMTSFSNPTQGTFTRRAVPYSLAPRSAAAPPYAAAPRPEPPLRSAVLIFGRRCPSGPGSAYHRSAAPLPSRDAPRLPTFPTWSLHHSLAPSQRRCHGHAASWLPRPLSSRHPCSSRLSQMATGWRWCTFLSPRLRRHLKGNAHANGNKTINDWTTKATKGHCWLWTTHDFKCS